MVERRKRVFKSSGRVSVFRGGDVDVRSILLGKIKRTVAAKGPHGAADPALSCQHSPGFRGKEVELSVDHLPTGLKDTKSVQKVFFTFEDKPAFMTVAFYCKIIVGFPDGFPAAGQVFSGCCSVSPAFGILDPAAGGRSSVLCRSRYKLCAGKQHALVQEKRLRIIVNEYLGAELSV